MQSYKNFLYIIFFIEICYFYTYIANISLRLYLKFMTVEITYKNKVSNKNPYNLVLFVDENFNISSLRKHISNSDYILISDLVKIRDENKKLLSFDISSKKKIILVSLKKNIGASGIENLGASFYDQFKTNKINNFVLISDTFSIKQKNLIGYFLHG